MAGIYIASKVRHAALWRRFREVAPICSSWIDLDGKNVINDWADHWEMCEREAMTANVLIIYSSKGDNMKGAIFEAGVAAAHGVPIFVVGGEAELGTWIRRRGVTVFETMNEAIEEAMKMVRPA